IREGLVVTPSKIPRSFASLICARSAVSMKNFIKCRFFYRYNMITRWERGEIKNGKVTYIAPLRPPTVAAFRPWRGSAGAGRIRLCRHKDNKKEVIRNEKLFSSGPNERSEGCERALAGGKGEVLPVALFISRSGC